MDIPVIDIVTKEIATIKTSEIMYVNRTGINGSMFNIAANNKEFRLLTNVELIKHLTDDNSLVKTDRATYVNPSKVKRLNNVQMSAEFENGKQASVSKLAYKEIEQLINKSR